MRPLFLANLKAHRRTNLAIAAACALAAAILTGALGVGDSVQHSRQKLADQRTGPFTHALAGPRPFKLNRSAAKVEAVPLAFRTAAASNDAGQSLPSTLYFIDDAFFHHANHLTGKIQTHQPLSTQGGIWINRALATKLNLAVGDDILISIPDASLPADLAVARAKPKTQRHTISRILEASELGDFSLRQSTQPVYNIFQPDSASLGPTPMDEDPLTYNANLWLVPAGAPRPSVDPASAMQLLCRNITSYFGLLKPRQDAGEVFLPMKFGDAVLASQEVAKSRPIGVLSYFVNQIESKTGACPYSFVTGIDSKAAEGCERLPALPADLADNEIVLTDWLADDLAAKVGETVTLRYTAVVGRELKSKTATFKVRAILPIANIPHGKTLSPTIPGLTDAQSCRSWKSGLDVDFKTIRKKDEAYWKLHGTTPKAFVNLAAARNLFASRYGDLTSIYFAAPARGLRDAVLSVATPEMFDIRVIDLAANARAAVDQAMPFGPLFLGLSLVLLVSAGVIVSLVVGVVISGRTGEIGSLTAIGFSSRRIRRTVGFETLHVALSGGVIGALLGMQLTQLVLAQLASHWAGAVAHFPIEYYVNPWSLVIAAGATGLVAAFIARRKTARLLRQCPAQLVRGEWAIARFTQRKPALAIIAAALLCSCVAVAICFQSRVGMSAAGIRFSAAAGAIIAASILLAWILAAGSTRRSAGGFGLPRLIVTGLSRRRKRAATTAGLLGAGLMISLSMGLFHLTPPTDPSDPLSATGGFSLWCQSAIPVGDDLSTPRGRARFGLDESLFAGAVVLPAYLAPGDDASCLNLSRPQTPAVLGIDFPTLRQLGCWGEAAFPAGRAVADEPTMVWSLGKQPGDEIQLGQAKLPLAPALPSSILQGFVVMNDAQFLAAHPAISGHQVWLVRCNPEQTQPIANALREAGEDAGITVTTTRGRLEPLMAVQNNYLVIFSALGLWGVVLGAGAMAAMAAGDVLSRRRELAMCVAMGFTRRRLGAMLAAEQLFTAAGGIAIGLGATCLAVNPAASAGQLDWTLLALTAGGVIGLATTATLLSLAATLRGNLVTALREE